MLTAHLRRGLLVGVVGGTAYGVFSSLVVGGMVEHAETFETGHGGGDPLVSEATTMLVGVGAGVLWGVLLGLLVFGALYYFLEPAIPGARDTRSYLLAAAGFLTVSGAPWLVLPPIPPGVEQTLPTRTRLIWYAGMMVVGGVGVGTAGYLYDRLHARQSRAVAVAVAALGLVVLVGLPAALAPANPTSGDVPATFVDAFRWLVVFGQLGLWFVLASTHAWLSRRASDDAVAPMSAVDAAPASES